VRRAESQVEASVESAQTQPLPQVAVQPDPLYGPFNGLSPVHRIVVSHENHEPQGSGEDAPPIWVFHGPENGLIGALDGLGGAGGELIKPVDSKERTGAWWASRRTRETVRKVYQKMIEQTGTRWSVGGSDEVYDYDQVNSTAAIRRPFDFTAKVREAIKADLTEFAAQTHAGGSGLLRSKMIKTLPTTLAVAWYDLGGHEYRAIWAGDSRVYCLHPEWGLQQATTDDLKTNADAMENLTADALMSNCVSASTDFVLHERRLQLPPHCVLLAATDGCFGYVRTPLHFEYLLLSTMRQAHGWQEWEEKLTAEIVQITGDDSTLSAAIIGWPDFVSCQKAYAARLDWCAGRVHAYDDQLEKVDEMERGLAQAREEVATTRRELWEEYRKTYELLAGAPTRDVPPQLDGNPPAKPRPAQERPGDDGEKP
jgi:serine/threonine protein phosphatase PrpC